MSTSPFPDRPDLPQLRRRAKELRDAVRRGEPDAIDRVARSYSPAPDCVVSLAIAQLVIARELGFGSWPKLKAAVESGRTGREVAVAFVAASVERRPREAVKLLQAHPSVLTGSIHAAAVLGEAGAVADMLEVDASLALEVDEARGWPPLLYACYSRWHQFDPSRTIGLAEVVRLLLGAGASVHTNNGARNGYRSALCGAVEVNNPDVVSVLLAAGANPDDGSCIAEAAGLGDHRCLDLLVSGGGRVVGTWAIGAAVYADDPVAITRLLDAVRSSGGHAATAASRALADAAAAEASRGVISVLLAAGADPATTDSDHGFSAVRDAVRAGQADTAALLIGHGAPDDSTNVDRLIGACRRADRAEAHRLIGEHPDLPRRFDDHDRAAFVGTAASASPDVIALMLEIGFTTRDRNGSGEQALHTAAYHGNADIVGQLIAAEADVDARDDRFEATPLAFATVGSGERDGRPGNYVQTVRLLIEARASRDDVWISDKPPSEELTELLTGYGIVASDDTSDDTSDNNAEARASLEADPARSLGTGLMADVAHHLEVACRTLDLD
ncbi:MAG: ankyrin repeat domain-containing protein, partial [Sciscionella sp.]